MKAAKENTKRYFSVEEANATLPLLRSILRDVTDLAKSLQGQHERLSRLQEGSNGMDAAHREEVERIESEFEQGQDRMREFIDEVQGLRVELKDLFTGLVDFPCWMNGREVYLCWRLGEPEVSHWHELDAGVAGRQKLMNMV